MKTVIKFSLICEPYAHNQAPNGILPELGFTKVKTYRTIPGAINFEQQVNRWELKRENLLKKNLPKQVFLCLC